MNKQIRIAIFHNEYDNSKKYAEQLAEQIDTEAKLIYFRDPNPCAEVLPMRASPNVAVVLFADTLEEGQQVIDILKQLDYFKKQDAVTEVVDELIEIATPLTPELEEKVAATFYGG